MVKAVDWKLISEELRLKRLGETEQLNFTATQTFLTHFSDPDQEKHYQQCFHEAADNFGEALALAVQRYWWKKFRTPISYDSCYRSVGDWQKILNSKCYDLGHTLFYAEERLSALERLELKFYILHFFQQRGVTLQPGELLIHQSCNRECSEAFCYVISFTESKSEQLRARKIMR